MALEDFQWIVKTVFAKNRGLKFDCPNSFCREKFGNLKQFVSHVKKCGRVTALRHGRPPKKTVEKCAKFSSYDDYKVLFSSAIK